MPLDPLDTSRVTQNITNTRSVIGVPENDKKLRKLNKLPSEQDETNSQVNLSASVMIKTSSSNDVDFAKVETIKAAIKNGELKMDVEKIANFLLQELKDQI